MQKRDYVERMIEQLAAAVARIVGLASDAKTDEAEAELDAAWRTYLGLARRDMAALDDATLAALLGAKAPLGASLFEAGAAIADARGDRDAAARLRRRAAVLRTRGS
jgi:hypothetical protein